MIKKTFLISLIFVLILSSSVSATSPKDFRLLDEYYDISLDKEWTIKFNNRFDRDSVGNSGVYVKDDTGTIFNTTTHIIDDYTILLKPQEEYKTSTNYTLYVTNNIKGVKGSKLEEQVIINFITEEADVDNYTYLSSHYEKDYFLLEGYYASQLIIKGATLSNYNYLWIRIIDKNSGEISFDKTIPIIDNKFKSELNIGAHDGNYDLNIFYGKSRYGTYDNIFNGISMVIEDNKVSFPKSYVHQSNLDSMSYSNEVTSDHRIINGISEAEKTRLKDLADEITSGVYDDYNKAYAISNWVSNNIYYDWDAYLNNEYGPTDAIGTLDNKKSVCQGYAELTRELMKSIGIPTRMVVGCALNYDEIILGWENSNHNIPNHAWNEVYVDGRWIIIDSTWNSMNQYINGNFNNKPSINKYFDPTLTMFSTSHKIIDRY